MKVKFIVVLTLAIIVSLPSLSMGVESVHYFDCGECHLPNGTLNELSTDNVCVRCHTGSGLVTTLNSGSRYNSVGTHLVTPQARFDAGDASNVHGNNPGEDFQTSHHWAISTTYNAAAGSSEPNRALYPNMYSQYNISTGKVTCTRCHDPHGDYQTNPKLLRLSADNLNPMTENELCEACHSDFNQTLGAVPGNNAFMTHPVMNSTELTTLTSGNPAYDIAGIQNYNSAAPYTNSVVLIEGGVSCSSCHGPHFTDSKASTPDGPSSSSKGDGTLLRSDGPNELGGDRNETAQLRSNLCQSCHTYKMHGDPGSTSNIGCMDCHGGHSYNNGTPSAFVLADVSPSSVPTYNVVVSTALSRVYDIVTPVDFPVFLDTAPIRDSWSDDALGSANGFCETCHGDIQDDGPAGGVGKLHAQHKFDGNQSCTDCHKHNDAVFSFNLDASAATCGDCHGFPPYKTSRGDRAADYDSRDGGYAYYNASVTNFASGYNYLDNSGHYKDEATTAHKTHAGHDLKSDAVTPVPGSENWYYYGNSGLENCKLCHGVDASTPSGGHKIDPITDSATFRNVPFSGIATGLDALEVSHLTPTYNDGAAVCNSVYCHSAGAPRLSDDGSTVVRDWNQGAGAANTPAWAGTGGTAGYNSILTGGTGAPRCQVCHGNDIGSMTTKNNTAAHAVHINPATLNYACGVCHENTAIDKDTLSANATDHRAASGGLHVNGEQNVVFNSTVFSGTLDVDKNNYNSTTGTCSVYCHDPADTGLSADWDTDINLACDSCHGGRVGDGVVISTGAHTRHVSDLNGPGLACAYCHDTGADTGIHAGHVDGQLILNSALLEAPGSGPLVADTAAICLSCHGYDAEPGEVQPLWNNPASSDCATCHAGTACGASFDGQTPDLLEWARSGGHNRKDAENGPYLQSGNPAAEADCLACHMDNSPNHWNGVNYTVSDDEADLLLLYNASGFGPGPYLANEDLYCANCHGDAGSRNHPTYAATQTNTQNMSTHRSKKCVACHNIHGEESNIQMIWSSSPLQVLHDPSATGKYAGGTVGFTNSTDFSGGNQNSYDEDDGNDGVDSTLILESNADDICAVCHSQAAGTAHNNIDNKSNLSHSGSANQLGTDCFECHAAHNDPGEAFIAGAGTSCDGCHGYPPSTARGASAAEVGAHGDGSNLHARIESYNSVTEDRSDCAWCHTGAEQYTYDIGADQAAGGDRANHGLGKTNQLTVLNSAITSVGYNSTNGSCSNACHISTASDGFWADTTFAGNSPASPGLECNACHYFSDAPSAAGNAAGITISATHDEHFEKNKNCTECHNVENGGLPKPLGLNHITSFDFGTGADANDGLALEDMATASLDEAEIVRGAMVYSAGIADGTGTNNTCSNGGFTTGCHASSGDTGSPVQPDWDVVIPPTSVGCVQCHTVNGNPAYNPFSGLHGNAIAPTVTGNSHDDSFYNGDGAAGVADCITCHTAQPTISATDHIDGNLDNGVNKITVYANAGYDWTADTCATVTECHSANQSGTNWEYKWNTAVFNNDGTECANCHGGWGDWRTGVTHRMDATVQTTHESATYGCRDCHALEATSGNYAFTSGTNDWNDTVGETSNHGNGLMDMNYNTTQFGRNGGGLSGCAECHNAYDGTATGQFSFTTTNWTNTAVLGDAISAGGCSTCHGGGTAGPGDVRNYWPDGVNVQDDVSSKDNSGEHYAHIIKLAQSVYPADVVPGDDAATIQNLLTDNTAGPYSGLTADDKQKELCSYCHITPAQVSDSGHNDTGLPAETLADTNEGNTSGQGFYELWEVPRVDRDSTDFDSATSNGSCYVSSCHNSRATDANVTNYGWYEDNATACEICHDPNDVENAVNTGGITHVTHTNSAIMLGSSVDCNSCHQTATEDVSWTPGVAPASNHINGTLNVAGSVAFTYSAGSCGTNACHNAGNGAGGDVPDQTPYPWGNDYPDNCVICHAATPTVTPAHTDHISNTTYVPGSCNECHTAATDATHINATADFGGAITAPSSNSGWNDSCTNNCHDSAFPGGTLWTDTAVANCVDCHAGTYVGGNDWRGITGKNYNSASGLHATTANNVSAHNDNATDSIYCVDCHLPYSTAPVSHVDGVWEDDLTTNTESRFLNPATMTYSEQVPDSSTCAGSGLTIGSCHSDGGNWARLWSTDADFDYVTNKSTGQAVCGVCHGYYSSIAVPGNGWRTGTVHATSGATKGSGHTDANVECEDCHAYPSAYNHEDGFITFSDDESSDPLTGNDYQVTWGTHASNKGWYCESCHSGDAGDDALSGGSHTFVDSLAFPSSVPATDSIRYAQGISTPEGGCTGCHGNTTTSAWWPDGSKGGVRVPGSAGPADQVGLHPEHVQVIGDKINGGGYNSATTSDKNLSCNYCHPNPGEGGHNDASAPATMPDNATSFFKRIVDGGNDQHNGTSLFGGVVNPNSTCSNIDCHFDKQYTPHWYDADDIEPDPVFLTLADGPHPGSLKLSWLSPGDDASVYNTAAYSYDMRMGPDTTTAEDFAATDNYVGGLPTTYLAGEPTEVIVDQLDPTKTYCFSLRTTDTGGNTSADSTNTPCQSPPADDVAPDFFGIDKATRGDEGGSANLWWTAAEDHSMYDLTNKNIKPILYNVWVKKLSTGPLDMGSDPVYLSDHTGTTLEIEGLDNNETYQFGVRACDQESTPNCEINDVVVLATPTAPAEVAVTVDPYTSEGGLTLVKNGTANSAGSTTFNDTTGVVFYGPILISGGIKYFVDSFTISLDPGNNDQTITAQVGVWDGNNFIRGGNTGSAPRGKRSGPALTSFKIGDTGGVVVNNGEAFAIRLLAGSGFTVIADYGTAATRGDASVAEQIINLPPPNVVSPSAILNPGEAIVNISWTPPTREVDGLDDVTEDPLHYDIYGSNNGTGGPWDYVIAEEYVGAPSITWDTQADGITSGSLAVRIKIGDGYGHDEVAIATSPVATADAIDYIPPSKITDLTALARPKKGSVQLRWTCSGDDFWNNGRASKFEIRYATSDVFTGGGYNSATLFDRPPTPGFGYHISEVEVTDLDPGQQYWFAIKTLDEQDNLSEKSNVAGPVLGGPRCGMCHTTGPSVVESEGNHKLHGKTLNDCTKCHGATAATYGLDHQDGQLTMGYTASGPVVGVINGSTITYYNGAVELPENIMYQDTNGFGGFGSGNYEKQGDGLDDGGCFNFGALGVGGCHGSAGSDPDGAETKYPQLDTPIWQGTASLECANCHGNPNRTLDPYGNVFDGTIANGDVVPDQIKGAPGTDNRGGWNYNSTNVDERMYIGRHEKHLNYSFRFSKNDSCALCHKGHYEVKGELDGKHGDGKVDIELDNVAAGVNAHYNTGTAGVVAGSCFDMDPFNCHPSDAEPKWDSTETFNCIGCHTMGGDPAKIGHYSDPAAGINEGSDYDALVGNCTWCHFPGHPTDDVGGEALILPNNPLVGIAYKSGGIHLRKDPGNYGHAGAPYATQAELCWGCHAVQTPLISEWGTDGLPLNNSATISPTAGDPNYDYGTLSSTTRGNWVGTWNGSTGTTAVWTSGHFSYKTDNIMSTHSTSETGVNDVTLSGGEYVETPDTVDNIQCHNCHDVHNMNFADGDTISGAPYLRGSWVRNPYREDGAPLAGNTYTNFVNDYGSVPRGGPGYNEYGGYQIDQNNIDATKGLTLGNSAGLCTLCHGTDVDVMDNPDGVVDANDPALWVGTNGHSNSALGGKGTNAADILNYTLTGGRHTISGTVPPEVGGNYPDPQNPNMGWVSAGSLDGTTDRRIDGFRSKYKNYGFGVAPLTDVINAYPAFAWGTVQDNGTKQTGFHAFTCSKCHNPHASRLPKLLITNCLDTRQNMWDDGRTISGTGSGQGVSPNADNNGKTLSNATSAQNCHRLGDASQGGTGGGWNLVTPRIKITP